MVIAYKKKYTKTLIAAVILLVFPVLYLMNFPIEPESNYNSLQQLLYGSFANKLIVPGLLLLVQVLLFLSGYYLVKAKGYNGWMALIGLSSVFGLAILIMLPDRAKNQTTKPDLVSSIPQQPVNQV